nr:uncharacterized protein LOC100199856 [Hydra vulgaris]XP_047126053.1 uncharacterized protein LOC100199856 [Hydra vulgaris]XP_047126054.1 uncharacterized protein LOC100199856 [Hydra vulgaris]
MCCKWKKDWKMHLEVISDEGIIELRPYHVNVEDTDQLTCYCFNNGIHTLIINGRVRNTEIYDNVCFPLCCVGGAYEWYELGHYFRLEIPSLFINEGLYVDGKEINKNRFNITEWKNQFLLWLVFAITLAFIGLIFLALKYTECCWNGFLYFGIGTIFSSFLLLVPGVLGLCKTSILTKKYKDLKSDKYDQFKQKIDVV